MSDALASTIQLTDKPWECAVRVFEDTPTAVCRFCAEAIHAAVAAERTCGTCRHWTCLRVLLNVETRASEREGSCAENTLEPTDTFGCNRWEKSEESTDA